MISGQSLTCPKGASLTFEIDMDTGSDLTGATAQWALCESWFDQAKVYLTKNGASEGLFINQDGGIWKIVVNLTPTDTLDIPSGLLYHDCKVLLQSGDVEDVANGPFSLDPSVNIFFTNAPITRNLRSVPQALVPLGQTTALTVSELARNLLAVQTLGGLGQAMTGTVTGGGSPVFTTDFTALSSLPAEISLSRATSGTRSNSSGVFVTEAIDAPRFDYAWNGSAWVASGLLSEEQRTNYAHPSIPSLPSGSSLWAGGGGSYIVNAGVAPDGTTTAAQVTCGDGTVADRSVYLDMTAAGASAVSTGAAWVKGTAGEKVYFVLYSTDYSNRVLITFDGTWQRIPTAPSSSAPQYVLFDTSTTGGADAINGLPSVTFLAWHVDVQGGSLATSTIPTTTAAVTRSADLLSSTSPLTGYLAAGPSVWEFQDEATGTISRTAYVAGAFDWPVNKWYRSMGVYPPGTDTSGHMVVGSAY